MTDVRSETAEIPSAPNGFAMTRRAVLGSAALGLGAGAVRCSAERGSAEGPRQAVSFHGRHQAGIATRQQSHLTFTAFDLSSGSVSDLQELLRTWSIASAHLCAGRPANGQSPSGVIRHDPGEAEGLGPSSLTVTIGLGAGLFERHGEDRLGLRASKPAALDQLRPLPGDELQIERSYGDLCIQACADDPQVAFHATHALALLAHGVAVPRWVQTGFLPARDAGHPRAAPRNLMGFKDGTNNIASDQPALRRHVWVGGSDTPTWMRNGTYLINRRIRMLLDVWDGLTVTQQERVVGRRKSSGAPLGGAHEGDAVDLSRRQADGSQTIPEDSHIRLAAAANNHETRILRRGYSYVDGIDPATSQIDAGLLFICFQRDPSQFASIQRRLGVDDALAKHISHTSSAVFACPPGARATGYVGEGLFSG